MHSRKKEYYATLDVGGTLIKAALLNSEYEVIANSYSITPIDSNGPSEKVINTITSVLEEKFYKARALGEVRGIGLCFPEFSDYKKGIIAVMKDKFQNSAGINLRDEIIKKLGLSPNFLIVFEEDSIAFLKGEVHLGNADDFNRIIGLTLGTGLGSAFMDGGKIVRNAPGVPPNGELGYLPYKGGIIEDIISSKGITSVYKRYTGITEKDVRSIALRAKKGDINGIQTFVEFGQTAGHLLKPYVKDFNTECIIIGGQIAKSFELFAVPLKKELSSISSLKEILQAESIDFSPFYGLLNLINDIL
jgi:glucokinase